ncbi:hypothetical protein KQ51_00520 [Candidatus Izimaplasma bacterium HR1]|jgi:hypothetical protein|uniref:hypothetical protein n=1 Tax=Candidatus Izimoplasma sp. HR1 TaxID=1541959 RepID=UPI0004F7040D|nr:hypothetical protein KQ51_00520 [Candidatus Izimaplasma bacterium HR1]
MTKMNRRIDETRMNESRDKSIDFVLCSIAPKTTRQPFFTRTRTMLLSTFVLIIALVVMFVIPNTNTPGTPVTINAYESERIAEVTYLTTSLIGSNIVLSNTDMMLLDNNIIITADNETTEFEDNDELINLYFDTLRVFLEDDLFQNSITTTISEDDPNTHIITFSIQEIEYVLTVTFLNNTFSGTLSVGGVTYDVTGKLEESIDELKLELEAVNGDDYVHIEFVSEQDENEIERKYQIHERINNVEKEQEIKVSLEENEYQIEIKDGENEYRLEKEMEGSEYQYKLEYKINGIEGEAIITESVDVNGNIVYQYQIKEGSNEKEIEHGRPNYEHEDDDEDEEDDEDDEDDSGNGENNGKTGNKMEEKNKIYLI